MAWNQWFWLPQCSKCNLPSVDLSLITRAYLFADALEKNGEWLKIGSGTDDREKQFHRCTLRILNVLSLELDFAICIIA